MRSRVKARLGKAIRQAEYRLPGVRAAIARHGGLDVGLCRLLIDAAGKRDHRQFCVNLLWDTPGTEDARLKILRLLASSGETSVLAAYFSLCSDRKSIHPTELKLFWEVLARGSSEEQITTIDGVSYIECPEVRRAFIKILNDTSVPLEVRERAIENLHLQGSRETTEACARALGDQNASIRFWAAYTLGETAIFVGAREIAASALVQVLGDKEIAPGWWSIGREAQAVIAKLRNNQDEKERLQAEIRRVQQNPDATAEDRRWAECYTLD
jgi:HEAT repeat protein